MDHPFQKEVQAATALAQKAGEMAKFLKAGSSYSFKTNGEGPVSNADIRADEIIVEGLQTAFPHDLVISEERSGADTPLPNEGRVWLIDPIDGTSDYILGGLDYSVMIGLLVDGKPRLGVIYGPETDETWIGATWSKDGSERRFAERRQSGHSKNVDLEKAPESEKAPILAISKHHPSRVTDRIIDFIKPSQIIRKGSLGLKMALIVDGRADLYAAASRHIKAWDTCAPFALLHGAGGKTYTFDGHHVDYGPTCTHKSPFFAVSHRCEKMVVEQISHHLGHYVAS